MENSQYLLIFVFIIMIIIFVNYAKNENMGNLSNEAIQNIANLYNTSDLTITNITVTNDTALSGNTVANNITVSGNITNNGSINSKHIVNNGVLENIGNISVTNGSLSIGTQPTSTSNNYPLYVNATSSQFPCANNPDNYGVHGTPATITAMGGPWPQNQYFYNYYAQAGGGPCSSVGNASSQCSAYFSNAIVTPVLVTPSDERIKTNIQNVQCIDTLDNIKVCSYDFIESNRSVPYGLLGQNVEKFIPESINTISDYVPNIMQQTQIKLDDKNNYYFSLENCQSPLHKGDMVKIYYKNDKHEVLIKSNKDNCFVIDKIPNFDDTFPIIFVVGTRINDFKTINYDSLIPLCIGSIQELNKIVLNQQAQINDLKLEIKKLSVQQ